MAGENTSLSNLTAVYTWVVEDVIKNVRAEFLNEGVDEQVLEELKQLWLAKIDQTKAVSRPQPSEPPPLPPPLQPVNPPPSSCSSPRDDAPRELLQVPSLIEKPQQPQVHLESVIQHAPPHSKTTPTTPSSTPSSSFSPSRSAIVLPAGYTSPVPVVPVAGGRGAIAVTAPTAIARPSLSVPQFVSPLMAAGGFAQGAQVIMPTSQGPVVMHLPFSAVMAMQQHHQQALAAAAQGKPPTSEKSDEGGDRIRQSDGPLPPPPGGEKLRGGRGRRGGAMEDEGLTDSLPVENTVSLERNERDGSYMYLHTDTDDIPTTDSVTDTHGITSQATNVRLPFPIPTSQTKSSRKCRSAEILSANPRWAKYPWARSRGNRTAEERILQVDGHGKGMAGRGESSSEEESDGDDDTSDEEDAEAGHDSEPLCSEDDIGSEKSEEGDFETHDSIICQWEKVYRVKTKWKFNLKDGVMHVAGHDYIFQKATGEAEW